MESIITKLKLVKLQNEYTEITKFITDLQSHIELLNTKLVINNVNKNMIMHDLYNILAKKDESINSLYNSYIITSQNTKYTSDSLVFLNNYESNINGIYKYISLLNDISEIKTSEKILFNNNPFNEIKSKLNNSLEQSLLGLQTDYIDIYMSHDGTEEVINNETVVDFYQKKKQEGTIRAIGVSVYTLEQSLAAINSGIWDVIQLQFNLMDQRQLPAIELASQKGIGIVVRSALFRGILTDRGSNLHPELKSVQDHREKCLSLVQGNIKTLSELATKFILSIKDVTSVLVGIDKSEYLQSALEVADGNYLDEKILEKAKELAYPDPEFLNLPIWDRKGWL